MWRPLSFAAKSPLSLEALCASLPTSSSTVNKTSSVLIVEITVRLKRSLHPSLICEPQTDQRARPSLQVTLWQVPRCGGEAHAHMSCYMAVKPRHRAQTPVGIQPTASTHQLCRRKIQIVSSIQTGGNKPPVLITSSHNFFFIIWATISHYSCKTCARTFCQQWFPTEPYKSYSAWKD